MAVTIIDINSTKFSINGVEYLKNFQSIINGDTLKIVGVYDSSVEIVKYTNYADFTLGGGGFASAVLLQSALLTVLYNKPTTAGATTGYQEVATLSALDSLIAGGTSGDYLILNDITLDANKTIPANVVLNFRGGAKIDFNGFTLQGTSTRVNAPLVQIFTSDASFSGVWKIKESYPQWFGAVGDGVTDDTLAVQASINKAFCFSCFIPHGDYLVSSPITIRSRMSVRGDNQTTFDQTTTLLCDTTNAWAQYRGVLETQNYADYSGNGDYAHGTIIENLQIDSDDNVTVNRPEYGVVIFDAGESCEVNRVTSRVGKEANFLLAGLHAVLTCNNLSCRYSDKYGVKMTNHPDATYPVGTFTNPTENGGAIRFYGISGDNMGLALMYADGRQVVECSGIKSEFNYPVITIDGDEQGVNRQRWNITGFSNNQTGGLTRNFIEIDGTTTKPQIFIGAGGQFGAIQNTIVDNVSGQNIPINQGGEIVIYDPYQTIHIVANKCDNFPKEVHQQGSPNGSDVKFFQTMDFNNPTSNFCQSMEVRNSATDTYTWFLRAKSNRYKFITAHVNNGSGGIDFNGWDGASAFVKHIEFDGAKGVNIMPASGGKLGFYGATNIIKPTGTPADATDLASALTLVNDLKSKLISLGLIS